MIFLTAQPDSDYYVWQLKVQMNNFRKLGIEKDAVILLAYTDKPNPTAKKFVKQTSAKIFFYEDTRKDYKYIPSIRPHIIAKFYESNSELIDSDIFYHDCDIIFRELPDFDSLSESSRVSMSDTVSYVGADYILSKSEVLFEKMCQIVGISPLKVRSLNNRSGGAQTFIPKKHKLNSGFWLKVEKDCESLYDLMISTTNIYSPNHPIQAWTADMWGVLWNLWLLNINTEIVPELNFSWATDGIGGWNTHKIMHNAGVMEAHKNLFFKGDYVKKSPFKADLSYVEDKYCSYMYVQEILSAKQNFK